MRQVTDDIIPLFDTDNVTKEQAAEVISKALLNLAAAKCGKKFRKFAAYKILNIYRENKQYNKFFNFAKKLNNIEIEENTFEDKYNELINEGFYEIKHKTIAVDFDGTLCKNKYPGIGAPNVDLINKLKILSSENTLILWTCRTGEQLTEAVEWCKNLGLEFDYVNENSEITLSMYDRKDSRKITADIYLDDKARTSL